VGRPEATDDVARIGDEQLATDGLGLPEDLGLTDVAEAVAASSTVYEVQRRLGLDGGDAWALLDQLDLLEFLLGRISEDRTGTADYETVADRIRKQAATDS
jgi:hypothetical protein